MKKSKQELFIEKLQSISPNVKKLLEPIKKLPPEFQRYALAKLYLKIKR